MSRTCSARISTRWKKPHRSSSISSRYGCTQEELAGRLAIDRSTIANLIRLLELPEEVQDAIRGGRISQGHARALLPLGDEAEQIAFCERIESEGLSVRATEEAVQEMIHTGEDTGSGALGVVSPQGAAKASRSSRGRNQNLASMEQEFRAALGTKVSIRQSSKGRGKIVIPFSTSEEFERLREYICGTPSPMRRPVPVSEFAVTYRDRFLAVFIVRHECYA